MDFVMDLGTAHFRVAVAGTNKILQESTVLARDRTGHLTIGLEAERMVGRNPEVIQVSHPVVDGIIKDVDAVADIIRHSVKSFMSSGLARKFNIAIAVPSGLTQVENKVVEDAARLAGARDVELVSSSVAAAVGVGLPIDKPTGSLVVNLGAGVTEAAVLSLRGVVASQRVRGGGRAIDAGIMDKVKKEYSFLLGEKTAEELKHRFSTDRTATELSVRGRNLRTGLPGEIVVPRHFLEDQLEAYSEAITDLVVHTISACPPELVGDITEQGIVLVGGGSQVQGLLELLLTRLEVPIIVADEPDTSVIRGLVARRWNHRRKSGLLPNWGLGSLSGSVKYAFNRVRIAVSDTPPKQNGQQRKSG